MALTKVTGGLLGNLPTGTDNVAVGDTALDSIESGASNNVAIGSAAGTAITTGTFNTIVGGLAGDALTTGERNTVLGKSALTSDTLGSRAVAVGLSALASQNFTTATENYNVAVGYSAGGLITTGLRNTIIGGLAGDALTDADNNVAVGQAALSSDTLGSNSVAIGRNALLTQNFTTATNSYNIAIGSDAGQAITTGVQNTLVGALAGDSITTGANNVAIGQNSLSGETTGGRSVAIGVNALASQNFTGNQTPYNVAIGLNAGTAVTTGVGNTFLGGLAGTSSTGSGVDNNTFIGFQAGRYVTSGEKNTVLGRYDGNQGGLDIRTSSNNIVLSDGDGNPRAYYDGGSTYPLWNFVTPTAGQNSMNLSHSSPASPYGPAIRFTAADPNNTTQYFLIAIGNTTARFVVYSNGDVANINNSYGAYSDVKLKENIIDASSQWDDIKALSVRKYSLKQDNLDAPNMLGVIAQEVEAAGMGGLVYETPDRDSENNDLGTVTKQVNYSILYMKAVKALQEAMERIETLEAKVTALES